MIKSKLRRLDKVATRSINRIKTKAVDKTMFKCDHLEWNSSAHHSQFIFLLSSTCIQGVGSGVRGSLERDKKRLESEKCEGIVVEIK